jgi:hypothetical protein
MALFSFIDVFQSALTKGRESALNKLLGSKETELITSEDQIQSLINESPGPLTQLGNTVAGIPEYNSAITTIYADLGSIYAESNNLWRYMSSIEALSQNEIKKLRLSVEDLETKVSQAKNNATSSKISYTDTIVETFNAQTTKEDSSLFYGAGTIPQAFIDTADGILKLPIDGEFLNQLSSPGIVPSNVYLDRIIGLPISDGHTVNNAFDGTITNFWNEVVHASAPIYCTTDQFPWLPIVNNDDPTNPKGYKGGAACRIKVELEHSTQVSELDIRPYGQHPMSLIAVGWTNRESNSLTDPTFLYGINSTPSELWYKDGSMFGTGNTGDADLYSDRGPDGQPAVRLYTFSPSGSVFLNHGAFSISVTQGLEVSFLAKTDGDTPIMVGVSFIASGGVLGDKVETIHLDSLGWTRVVITFDPPPGTETISFRIGIPPFFERKSELWLSDIFIEPIKEFIVYEKVDGRRTIFLPYPINANRIYLVFSQENYTFKHYSLDEYQQQQARWERLTRRINTLPQILDWDKEINRGSELRVPVTSRYSIDSGRMLRDIEGTSWQLLEEIEKYAYPQNNTTDYPVYEYQMGAFEIYLRHREYAPSARYVSLPVKANGEIREIRLESNDSTVKGITGPDSIKYTITLTENDPPEKGKQLLNSKTFGSDTAEFSMPPPTIPYLDYSTWTYGSSAFQAVLWPNTVPETADILLVQLGKDIAPNMYIQKNLDTTLDLSGAAAIVGEFYLYASNLQRLPVEFKFTVAFSSDGNDWSIAGTFGGAFHNDYNIDDSKHDLVMFPFVINITNINTSLKSSIQHIRITAETPTYYKYTTYLMLRRFRTEGYSSGARTLRFYPSDDVESTIREGSDFIIPVKHVSESIDGTDRYGRVYISNYPYINRTRILSLVESLSSNLGGRKALFDPNAIRPKYLDNDGIIKAIEGYRPIEATLYFPDTGLTVNPDSIGKPKPEDFLQSVDEILAPADMTQVSSSVIEKNHFQEVSSSTTATSNVLSDNSNNTHTWKSTPSSKQATTTRSFQLWQTRYKNIAAGKSGINFTAKWSSPSGDVNIDPLKIIIDADLGLVQVLQAPPNSSYTQVKATYWYMVTEDSPRENFFNLPSSGSYVGLQQELFPQKYPVTRNMTNYLTGEIPALKPPVLDPLDGDYYPVYEYYVHPDGYLVFAENMHKYSDTPAVITVGYDTLGINPRIIIDLSRPSFTNQTPYVDDFKLLLNVRRT